MNTKAYISVIFAFSILIFASASCKKENPKGLKLELPAETGNQVVEHFAYTVSYNEKHEQADWVAYELTKEEVESDVADREDDFRPDPDITTETPTTYEYTNSGFDRGHLCPAADNKWSETAMSESFFTSNISPQLHKFNAGKWLYLEKQVRAWAVSKGKVYVAVGGILGDSLEKIDGTNISVPKYFYKVILDYDNKTAIGFIMPNIDIQDSFKYYAVTIDKVEEETGLDFFYQLPDDEETKIEKLLNLSDWNFDYY